MKLFVFILATIPFLSFSQITKTTISNGNFYNPLIWDCTCLPSNGDNVIINHSVTLNNDIYYNTGKITINASGSLVQDAIDRDIWIDGNGQLINHGNFSVNNMLLSQGAYIDNTGAFYGIDSLLTQGIVNNSGSIEAYDFLNDLHANFGNFGLLSINNDMNNQGNFDNYGEVNVANDFSNCNTQSGFAEFTNYDIVCITNNFLNCDGDELNGTGHYYIGNLASNFGLFSGTFTFHTPSGNLAVQGIVGSGVTITTGACTAQLNEDEIENYVLYPNPTENVIFISGKSGKYNITDIQGKTIQVGLISKAGIDVSSLKQGLYLFKIENVGVIMFKKN